MSVTVTIPADELQKATRSLAFWTEKKRADVRRAISKGVIKIDAKAKTKCPVDTGRLRSSINPFVDADGLGGGVGTNVHYAPHVEYGTIKMDAQPYLRPAAREEQDDIIAEISLALKQL